MSAFSPKSSAALVLEAEQRGLVRSLLASMFPGAEVHRSEQLSEDVIECLLTVPEGERMAPRTAWICRSSGSVQVMDGWPVL